MEGADPRVAKFLEARGIPVEIHHYPEGTVTAEEAAELLNVPVRRIVKTIVLIADGNTLVALCGGNRRVDFGKLARTLGAKKVRLADRATAEAATGFPVGGVGPVGLATDLPVFADKNLVAEPVLYAGAGTTNALFSIDSSRLLEISRAKVVDLSRD